MTVLPYPCHSKESMTGQNVKFSMSDYSDGRIQIHKKSYPQSVMFIVFIKCFYLKKFPPLQREFFSPKIIFLRWRYLVLVYLPFFLVLEVLVKELF